MKKTSFSLLIMIILISLITPVFAFSIIEDNILGNEIDILNDSERMINNYGTIKRNEGSIENNYGVIESMDSGVTNNYGTIKKTEPNGAIGINDGLIEENGYKLNLNRYGTVNVNNYEITANEATGVVHLNNSEILVNTAIINQNKGAVTNNFGEILTNYGTVEKNQYASDTTIKNIVVNAEGGKVLENYAKVEYGIIEKNYSKDVTNLTINDNYSNEVGENVTIKRNFANFIDNANIENQYYKLTIEGNADLVCTLDSNNNLNDNIYIDQEGQTWIRAEDSMYTITAKENYKIVGIPTIIAAGTTAVSKEDTRNVSFSGINGEITIKVETEEIETFKVVFDANGGKFSNGSEILTYEKWLPEDYENLENPVKENCEFLGYFTEKDGGTNFANYYNESGVDQDMTLYAHWKENSGSGTGAPQQGTGTENISENQLGTATTTITTTSENFKTNNPQTGNSIIVWCVVLMFAITGIIITRKNNKN